MPTALTFHPLAPYITPLCATLEQYITGDTCAVRQRQRIEMQIAHAFIFAACEAGYMIVVDDGEEGEAPRRGLSEYGDILKEMSNLDECRLHLTHKRDNGTWKHIGWVFFVFGNDGYDVISDYALGLNHQHLIEKGVVNDLVEFYGGAG